ncbi:MAG: hypothetical protein R3C68_14520 [Myxococcota bacterium]
MNSTFRYIQAPGDVLQHPMAFAGKTSTHLKQRHWARSLALQGVLLALAISLPMDVAGGLAHEYSVEFATQVDPERFCAMSQSFCRRLLFLFTLEDAVTRELHRQSNTLGEPEARRTAKPCAKKPMRLGLILCSTWRLFVSRVITIT